MNHSIKRRDLMLLRWTSFVLMLAMFGPVTSSAAEYRLEMVDCLPEGVDPSMVKQLEPQHIKLKNGDSTELCEIWIAKSWTTGGEGEQEGDFAPTFYPLLPGSLVGVLRVLSPSLDFREQELPAGVYTLRYALQPDLDVHHESHESRDFLLILPAGDDRSPEPMTDPEKMVELSTAVTLTTHPSIIPLVKPVDTDRAELLRPDELDPNGSILLLNGRDGEGKKIPLELIVIRAAEEAAP